MRQQPTSLPYFSKWKRNTDVEVNSALVVYVTYFYIIDDLKNLHCYHEFKPTNSDMHRRRRVARVSLPVWASTV
jgi:hypothetical protein